eukprot:750634-Hanusia_phi.AAC.2
MHLQTLDVCWRCAGRCAWSRCRRGTGSTARKLLLCSACAASASAPRTRPPRLKGPPPLPAASLRRGTCPGRAAAGSQPASLLPGRPDA